MSSLVSILLLALALCTHAEPVFMRGEPDTSLTKLKQIEGVEIHITTNPSGLVDYWIEINVDSPLMKYPPCDGAFLVVADGTGAILAEAPLNAFQSRATRADKKEPFFILRFTLKEALAPTSYLQLGRFYGVRNLYQKVWLAEEPEKKTKTTQ